jgi:hypothetical protein
VGLWARLQGDRRIGEAVRPIHRRVLRTIASEACTTDEANGANAAMPASIARPLLMSR